MKKIRLGSVRAKKQGFTFVSDEDYHKVKSIKWSISSGGYVVGGNPQKKLHRVITNCPVGMEVDHIDGNRLNNRRENLRICTRAQNAKNKKFYAKYSTTGFKGVVWRPEMKKYMVSIRHNGPKKHIGYFNDLIEAALAYNKVALELHGEFARLNEL